MLPLNTFLPTKVLINFFLALLVMCLIILAHEVIIHFECLQRPAVLFIFYLFCVLLLGAYLAWTLMS